MVQVLFRKTCQGCQEDSVMPAGQDYCPSCLVRVERPATELRATDCIACGKTHNTFSVWCKECRAGPSTREPGIVTPGPTPPVAAASGEVPREPAIRLPAFPLGHLYAVVFRVGEQVRMTECVVPHEGDVVAAVYLIDRSWPGAVITRMEAVGPVEADLFRPQEASVSASTMTRKEFVEQILKGQPSRKEPVQSVKDEDKEVTCHTHPSEVPAGAGGYAPPANPGGHDFDDEAMCRKCGQWYWTQGACRPSRQEQAFQAGNKQAVAGRDTHDWGTLEAGDIEVKVCNLCGCSDGTLQAAAPCKRKMEPGCGHDWKEHPTEVAVFVCKRCGCHRKWAQQVDVPCPGTHVASEVSHVIGKLLGPGCHQWMPDSSGSPSLFRCDRCGDVRHVTACTYPDCPGGLLSWEYRHQWSQEESKGMPCCLHCGLQAIDSRGSPVCPGKPVTPVTA
jgi:hypothetical protein